MSDANEARRRRAAAQLNAVIDVLSAWRGRYEDDDRHADIRWIKAVVPEMEVTAGHRRGWLCVSGTTTPGIGWQFRGGQFIVGSVCGSMRGTPFTRLTRGQFRAAAGKSGVSLPACHATLYLGEKHEHDWHPFRSAWQWKCLGCGEIYRVPPPSAAAGRLLEATQ